MIIDCISDLHGHKPELEGGDLLIVAGDLTAMDTAAQHQQFTTWLNNQDYKDIVLIAGNHDGKWEEKHLVDRFLEGTRIQYLEDFGTEVGGLKIWGSPWTPEFCDWYFMLKRGEEIRAKWDLIPEGTDILVTHGPAWSILDTVWPNVGKFSRVGCMDLLHAVERVRPTLHVFGHVHGGHGKMLYKHEGKDTICVNAAIMNEDYEPENKPIRVVL